MGTPKKEDHTAELDAPELKGKASPGKSKVKSTDVQVIDQILQLVSSLSPSSRSLLGSKLTQSASTSVTGNTPGTSDATLAHSSQGGATGVTSSTSLPHFIHTEAPRLCSFSGSRTSKSDASYQQWHFEVMSLVKSWPEHLILQAVRRSVRGMAADALLNLGMEASVQEILTEFDSVFGNVSTPDQIISNFYMATQKLDESAAEWGCRLSGLAREAKKVDPASSAAMHNTLKSKFFSGLASQRVKDCLRHKQEDADYETLLRAARSAEEELESASTKQQNVSKPKAVNQMHVFPELTSIEAKLDQLVSQVKSLEHRISSVETTNSGQQPTVYCYRCGEPGHKAPDCPTNQQNRKTKKSRRGQQKQSGPGNQQTQDTSCQQRSHAVPQQPGPYSHQPGNFYAQPGVFQQQFRPNFSSQPQPSQQFQQLQFGPTASQMSQHPYQPWPLNF